MRAEPDSATPETAGAPHVALIGAVMLCIAPATLQPAMADLLGTA